MKSAARLVSISVGLLSISLLPWLLLGYAARGGAVIHAGFVLVAIALILLIADLVYFKNISREFGARVNQSTTRASFSMSRMGYLLLVYLTPVSAVLALLAWAKTLIA